MGREGKCVWIAYEWECGVEWESGEPARHHICVKKERVVHGVCRCICGEEKGKEVEVDAVQ